MRKSFKLYSDHVVEMLSINFRKSREMFRRPRMEKENEEKFGEERSLPARGGEDRTRGKVLGGRSPQNGTVISGGCQNKVTSF